MACCRGARLAFNSNRCTIASRYIKLDVTIGLGWLDRIIRVGRICRNPLCIVGCIHIGECCRECGCSISAFRRVKPTIENIAGALGHQGRPYLISGRLSCNAFNICRSAIAAISVKHKRYDQRIRIGHGIRIRRWIWTRIWNCLPMCVIDHRCIVGINRRIGIYFSPTYTALISRSRKPTRKNSTLFGWNRCWPCCCNGIT